VCVAIGKDPTENTAFWPVHWLAGHCLAAAVASFVSRLMPSNSVCMFLWVCMRAHVCVCVCNLLSDLPCMLLYSMYLILPFVITVFHVCCHCQSVIMLDDSWWYNAKLGKIPHWFITTAYPHNVDALCSWKLFCTIKVSSGNEPYFSISLPCYKWKCVPMEIFLTAVVMKT
jgi:hypothetical protein